MKKRNHPTLNLDGTPARKRCFPLQGFSSVNWPWIPSIHISSNLNLIKSHQIPWAPLSNPHPMPVTDPSTPVPDAPGARLAEAPEGLQDHRTARPGSHRPERDPWMGTWWTWVPTCLDVETNRPEGWMDGWMDGRAKNMVLRCHQLKIVWNSFCVGMEIIRTVWPCKWSTMLGGNECCKKTSPTTKTRY